MLNILFVLIFSGISRHMTSFEEGNNKNMNNENYDNNETFHYDFLFLIT